MAFHELRAPELPIFQQRAQGFVAIRVTVAAKEFTGSGRRAGAGVEQRDIDLALGEGSVYKWEIADHRGKKAETKTSFRDDQKTSDAGMRNHVAESKSEERGSAEITIRVQAGGLAEEPDGPRGGVLHHAERQDQSSGPDADEEKQRDGAVET